MNFLKIDNMGVMSCSREDCDNIMCDTYIQSIGYICNGCQTEFKEINNVNTFTENTLINELKTFMDTPKRENYGNDIIDIDDFFKKNTRGY